MASPPPPHGSHPYTPSGHQPGAPYAPESGGPYATPPAGGPGGNPYAQGGPPAGQPLPGQHVPGPYPYAPQPAPYQPGAPGCRFCGAQPAVQATVRGHQGLLIMMRSLTTEGPFCRNCGLATFRRMSADTLVAGWWSPLSVAITPLTLLLNILGPRARFVRLAPPVGGFRPSLDPGKPLTLRPQALLFLVPMMLIAVAVPVLIVIGVLFGDPESGSGTEKTRTLSVGDCVRNDGDWTDQDLQVTDCGSADARYRVSRRLEEPGSKCADGEYYADLKYGPGGTTVSCLELLR
ncbi:LppU/SCO3897 family protein [Streptomyces sp. 8N706]|uniref:LppU/SCO3897 family protein n=1 Tax=Streptomyces sp. 8N706 TaxID=3457416 RepID=UPI003FCF860A